MHASWIEIRKMHPSHSNGLCMCQPQLDPVVDHSESNVLGVIIAHANDVVFNNAPSGVYAKVVL
jgi:hypothetical protein